MQCPGLDELPPPPPGRIGWPWTAAPASASVPPDAPDGAVWPRISVVIPSYNQGAFLEETIRSVLLQGYPDIELMVMDGGSSDGSIAVIRKYEQWLAAWCSERDSGQSHAINKGWERATGQLLAWLCSDDIYLPGCLWAAARAWRSEPSAAMVTGGIVATDEQSREQSRRLPHLPVKTPADITLLDHETMYLPQPSSFFSREHLDRVGRWLRTELQYTMDREIMYRLCRSGRVLLIPQYLATYREHPASKTISCVLAQHAETPRSLELCTWGDAAALARRTLVGRWRVAKGHYNYASHCASRWETLRHLAAAVRLRPAYALRKNTLRLLLRSAGLLDVLRRLKRMYGSRRKEEPHAVTARPPHRPGVLSP